MKFGFILMCVLSLNHCTTATEFTLALSDLAQANPLLSHGNFERSNKWLLTADTKFYLARNNHLTALNSENSDVLTDVIYRATVQHFTLTQVAMAPESYEQALMRAKSLGADFLIFPSISIWDSRVGGKPEQLESPESDLFRKEKGKFGLDRAQVQLMIVHSVSGTVFEVAKLDAQAGLLTTFNSSPESVLIPQLKALFSSLVAKVG